MEKASNEPVNLSKIFHSVHDKIFEADPFSLLTTKVNKDYAALIMKECGVTEKAVHKILVDSFEADSIILEVAGDDPELTGPVEAIFQGYTKAIEALEKVSMHKAIIDDRTFDGCAYGRAHISLREAIQDDIDDLKKKRAKWAADRYTLHPELKAEPIPKSTTAMLVNQAYSLFRYIEKCHDKAGWKVEAVNVHELISELFRAIYNHSFFAPERFTPDKIKEYCDNGKSKYKELRKTRLRKSIESL